MVDNMDYFREDDVKFNLKKKKKKMKMTSVSRDSFSSEPRIRQIDTK